MMIRSLELRRFRGIKQMRIVPQGDVVLVGEPRAGRSTIIAALARVLSPDASRGALGDDLDLHGRNRGARAEVEVVIGDLGDELTQRFFDQLEYWDDEDERLVDQLDALDGLGAHEEVVRLCYRARWSAEQEQAEHWVDYPKLSDPDDDVFELARRADLAALPAFFGDPATRPLALSHRGGFRELVDATEPADFATALDALSDSVEALGRHLAASEQLLEALRSVVTPIAPALGFDLDELERDIAFVPAGVALGALLRALEATLVLDDSEVRLPLSRHGSTTTAALAAAELLARGARTDGIVVIDDFGEHLDAATARHLAATLRRSTGQTWLSTRRAEVAAAFPADELVRLAFGADGRRVAHPGRIPTNKAERIAARHTALQLLPAATAHGVVVLEGPHDRAALEALAERRLRRYGTDSPSARRIALIDAGAADASGGSSATPRLCAAARQLGFFAVAVIDGDRGDEAVVAANVAAADAVVRLPDGMAIEGAVLDGLGDKAIRSALRRLDLPAPADLDELSGGELRKAARKTMKSSGGVHAQFIDALPPGAKPRLAKRILDEATRCITELDTGLHQL